MFALNCVSFDDAFHRQGVRRGSRISADDCVWGLDFYINSLIYSGEKING